MMLTKLKRGLARLRREGLADTARRGVHRLRHSRLTRRGARGGVFDLDLHISVIADIRVALEERSVPLTEWNLSGHTWVFGREREPVWAVNERTTHDFGPRMVTSFQKAYGGYLRGFDGFVATYPPCFSLLYRGLDAPTLAVCATRYEWPFTYDRQRWEWLDSSLAEGIEEGWLTLAANNRADADYVEHYSGLKAVCIPSACSYIAPLYTGRQPAPVVSAATESLARTICDELGQDAVPLRTALGRRYTWSQLYDQRAIVLIPYNVSIMALFEHYSACAPIYVPDRSFLKELAAAHPKEVLGSISFSQVTGEPAARRPADGLDLNDLRDGQVIDWYLDRADFYDPEWMPLIRLFESWAHLAHLLATDDQLAISEQMAAEKPARLARIAALWDQLDWTKRVAP